MIAPSETEKNSTKLKKEKVNYWDWMKRYAPFLQFVVLSLTAITSTISLLSIGLLKGQITTNLYTSLADLEYKIYSDAMLSEREYLISAIYFDESPKKNFREKADLIINKVAQCPDSLKLDLKWNSIPQLYNGIMSLGDTSSVAYLNMYHHLMSGISVSDRIFFLVYRAYTLYESDKITITEWNDYKAYIRDFAQSPLFLCTIYINHKEGYFNDRFAEFIQDEYAKDPEIANMIQSLYPDIFSENWVKQVKEGRNKQINKIKE
jgi:hypothetical protein